MGSNMMRQAVPPVTCEAPIVGTGIESRLAISDSRIQIVAEGDGEVVFADATQIRTKYERTPDEVVCSFAPEVTTHELLRYRRTNQNTSITLKPVADGRPRDEGADPDRRLLTQRRAGARPQPESGPTCRKGYTFEDAIVISERIQREDIFTSVHVDEYIMEVRDTQARVSRS